MMHDRVVRLGGVRPRSLLTTRTDVRYSLRHGRGEGNSPAGGAGAGVELTEPDKRFRLDFFGEREQVKDDDDDDDIDVEDDGRDFLLVDKNISKTRMDSEFDREGSFDSTNEDEELLNGDDADHESLNRSDDVSLWGASVNRMRSNLLLIICVVAGSSFYKFHEDKLSQEPEYYDEGAIQKVPYSYKGYKDARIPDDDVAQYGGQLFSDLYGIDSNENESEGDEADHDVSSNQKPIYHKHTGISRIDSLWLRLDDYAEIADPNDPQQELPIFWHVPKSGGNSLQDLMINCYGMIGANEIGAKYLKEALEIVSPENGSRYVNVDLSNPDGISNAIGRGFVGSGLADVVITSWFYQAASLFDSNHKGR